MGNRKQPTPASTGDKPKPPPMPSAKRYTNPYLEPTYIRNGNRILIRIIDGGVNVIALTNDLTRRRLQC